jgi:hypothetical protein
MQSQCGKDSNHDQNFEVNSSLDFSASVHSMSSSAGSSGGGRVGLARPRPAGGERAIARGARGAANQLEINRQNSELEINRQNSEPPAIEIAVYEPENQIMVPQLGEVQVISDEEHEDEPEGEEQQLPGNGRRSGNRAWEGNHQRLNIMARSLLMSPFNAEAAAASNPAERESIRNMKRDPALSLGWGNIKNNSNGILIARTRAELNADPAYLQASGNTLLNHDELLRQKIRKYTGQANLETNIGPSKFSFQALNSVLMFFLQTQSSGSST